MSGGFDDFGMGADCLLASTNLDFSQFFLLSSDNCQAIRIALSGFSEACDENLSHSFVMSVSNSFPQSSDLSFESTCSSLVDSKFVLSEGNSSFPDFLSNDDDGGFAGGVESGNLVEFGVERLFNF